MSSSSIASVDNVDAIKHGDIVEAEGFIRKTGSGTYEAIKTNLNATSNPILTDDSGLGYAIGSRWVNISNDSEWVCLDATVSAAVWKDITAGVDVYDAVVETQAEYESAVANSSILTIYCKYPITLDRSNATTYPISSLFFPYDKKIYGEKVTYNLGTRGDWVKLTGSIGQVVEFHNVNEIISTVGIVVQSTQSGTLRVSEVISNNNITTQLSLSVEYEMVGPGNILAGTSSPKFKIWKSTDKLVMRTFTLENPVATDRFCFYTTENDIKLKSVVMQTDVGTVDFDLVYGSDLMTGATEVWGTDKQASSTKSTELATSTIPVNNGLAILISAVASSPTKITIGVLYSRE